MPKEDAARPEFWEKRFREGFTPWDAGKIPAALEQFLKTEPRSQRALIPGCGSAYDERAFLCALPRRLWPSYARRLFELLRPEGRLAGFFYFDDGERGPPFGLKT